MEQKIKFLVNDELAYCIQNHNEFYDDFKKENYLDFLITLKQNESVFNEVNLVRFTDKEGVTIMVGEGNEKENLTFNIFIQDNKANMLLQIELSLHYREHSLGYCECVDECEGLACDWSAPFITTKVITETVTLEYEGNMKQLKEEREQLKEVAYLPLHTT